MTLLLFLLSGRRHLRTSPLQCVADLLVFPRLRGTQKLGKHTGAGSFNKTENRRKRHDNTADKLLVLVTNVGKPTDTPIVRCSSALVTAGQIGVEIRQKLHDLFKATNQILTSVGCQKLRLQTPLLAGKTYWRLPIPVFGVDILPSFQGGMEASSVENPYMLDIC